MDPVELSVPASLVETLPPDSDDARSAMHREVEQYQTHINAAIDRDDGANAAMNVIERLQERWEQYDGYIVELRSWGQSSIYAEVWCDFQYALIQQLSTHDELGPLIERERRFRLVDDGIRLRDVE